MVNDKVSEIEYRLKKYVFGDVICEYTLSKCDTPDLDCSKCNRSEQDRYGPVSSGV